jgi:hypothetical protein
MSCETGWVCRVLPVIEAQIKAAMSSRIPVDGCSLA